MQSKQILMGVTALALIMSVVGMATDKWGTEGSSGGLKANMGLWKQCVSGNLGSSCIDLPPQNDSHFPRNSLYAVRVWVILGVVLLAASMWCMTMAGSEYANCGAWCLVLGGVSLLLGVILFSAELLKFKMGSSGTTQTTLKMGWSMGVVLGAGILALGAGAYQKMGMMKSSSPMVGFL